MTLAETRAMLVRIVDGAQSVMDMLNERAETQEGAPFAHDEKLRAFLDPYIRWHREIIERMDRDGDAFVLPAMPPELADGLTRLPS